VAKSVNICNIIALLSSIYRRISVLPRSLLGKVFRKTACHLGIDRAVLVLVLCAIDGSARSIDRAALGVTKHRTGHTGRTGPKYWSFLYEKE